MTDTEQDRILNRVRKMLNLATNAGATEGERDNAMRMAHATLAKYNLDLAMVETTEKAKIADEPRVKHVHAFYGYPWARRICQSVGLLFFCKYLYLPGNNNKTPHIFVGRQTNAVTASLIAEFVVNSVLREGRALARARGENAAWIRSFALGAASMIAYRVRKLQEENRPDAPTVSGTPGVEPVAGPLTALVLASLYKTEAEANEAFIQAGVKPKVEKRKMAGAVNTDAMDAGVRFAKDVSLDPQLR